MTALMLFSLLISGVVAEVPDGDGVNGIDRNPTAPEQDRTGLERVYDPVNAQSSQTLAFDGNRIFSDEAIAQANHNGGNVFATQTSAWTITAGTANAGDAGVFAQTSKTHQGITVQNAASGVSITYSQSDDAKDVAGNPTPTGATQPQALTVTIDNWYSTLDRTSTSATAGTSGAHIQDSGCEDTAIMSSDVMGCLISGDTASIGTTHPTMLYVKGGSASNGMAYGVVDVDGSSADLFMGVDYGFDYNITVSVGGDNLPALSTVAANEVSDIVVSCADVNCTQDSVRISSPTAYNYSSYSSLTGIASNAELYNTSSMVAHSSGNIVKLTFGVATEDRVEAATTGVFYDPSIEILTAEPGIKMGVIENGGATLCSDWWFMAGCDGIESFDGNASNGVDGIFMEITMPLETLYSLSSFGGYDSAEVRINHPAAANCFNGEVRTYVVSDWENSMTKNGLLTYLTSGDKYDVATIGGFDSAYVLGTASTDYCTGSTSTITQTAVPVGALKDLTKDSLTLSNSNGFYDLDERTFTFSIVMEFVASGNSPTSGQSMTLDMSEEPTVVWKTASGINPLANSTDIVRTGQTGSTNPVPASPYALYYSGVALSDNVIQGRTLQIIETQGSTFGGTQSESDMNQRQDIEFAPSASTPRSTIECGLAAAGVEYVSAKISVFTNVDTSGNTGENETEWKPYGVVNANNSRWSIGPVNSSNTGNGSVDNDELNAGSSTVSYTGVFINGDNYKAVCEFVIKSYDVGSESAMNTTIQYTQLFSAAEDGEYSSGSGGDVDSDDGWFDDFDGWDLVVIGLAAAIILMGALMYGNGRPFAGLFDDRLAMILFGVGVLHAWFSHHYFYDVADPISEEFALVAGSLGYLVIALSIYLYGGMTTSRGERNVRYVVGGLLLIILGTPTAVNGIFNTDISAFNDVAWGFPIYDLIAGIGALIGFTIFISAAAGLYRREGM